MAPLCPAAEKLLSEGLWFMSLTLRGAFGCNLRAEAEGDAPGSCVKISAFAASHQFELVLRNAGCFFLHPQKHIKLMNDAEGMKRPSHLFPKNVFRP